MIWPRQRAIWLDRKPAGIFPQAKSWQSKSISQYICIWVMQYEIKGVDLNTYTFILGTDLKLVQIFFFFSFFSTDLFQVLFSTILLLPKTIISQNGHHDTNAAKCRFKQFCQPGCFWKVTWYTRGGSYPRLFIIVMMQPQDRSCSRK